MAKRQDHKDKALVRTLVYALGVRPDEFGLVPDEGGWVRIKELIKALQEQEGWRGVRRSMIEQAATRLAPEELALEDGKVRALTRTPPRPRPGVLPPAHIYIALRQRAWPAVKQRGLAANETGPVVMAAEPERALTLGRRQDPDPALITVQANQAMEQGVIFSSLGESLFLADWVPADCLMGPPVGERPPAKKPAVDKPKPKDKGPSMPSLDQMPGSFILEPEDTEKPYKQKGIKKDIAWKKERRKDSRRRK